jgi:hypothetical protein
MSPFVQKLEKLKNVGVEVAADDTPDSEGTAAIGINFQTAQRCRPSTGA